jgi:glycosyltransferase involved in cell wall biosynthesis
MQPKVSAIISCFKSDRYIETFLRTMEYQTYDNFELVIHTNETSQLEKDCINHAKQFIDIVHIEDDNVIPLYAAWNKCIEHASGDLICINNADDLRTNDSIASMVESLNDNVDFCYGNFFISNNFGNLYGRLVDETGRENELTTAMILGPFFMFRKSVIEKCGAFDEQFKSGGDLDFAMRLARNFDGIHTNKVLGVYLDEGTGLSTGSELQPLERTVIELRYGLNILEPEYIEKAKNYDLQNITVKNSKTPVKDLV